MGVPERSCRIIDSTSERVKLGAKDDTGEGQGTEEGEDPSETAATKQEPSFARGPREDPEVGPGF